MAFDTGDDALVGSVPRKISWYAQQPNENYSLVLFDSR